MTRLLVVGSVLVTVGRPHPELAGGDRLHRNGRRLAVDRRNRRAPRAGRLVSFLILRLLVLVLTALLQGKQAGNQQGRGDAGRSCNLPTSSASLRGQSAWQHQSLQLGD